jgi:hypothetical protein
VVCVKAIPGLLISGLGFFMLIDAMAGWGFPPHPEIHPLAALEGILEVVGYGVLYIAVGLGCVLVLMPVVLLHQKLKGER